MTRLPTKINSLKARTVKMNKKHKLQAIEQTAGAQGKRKKKLWQNYNRHLAKAVAKAASVMKAIPLVILQVLLRGAVNLSEDAKKKSDVEEYECLDLVLIIVSTATINVHAASAVKVLHKAVTTKGIEIDEGVAVEVILIVIDVQSTTGTIDNLHLHQIRNKGITTQNLTKDNNVIIGISTKKDANKCSANQLSKK